MQSWGSAHSSKSLQKPSVSYWKGLAHALFLRWQKKYIFSLWKEWRVELKQHSVPLAIVGFELVSAQILHVVVAKRIYKARTVFRKLALVGIIPDQNSLLFQLRQSKLLERPRELQNFFCVMYVCSRSPLCTWGKPIEFHVSPHQCTQATPIYTREDLAVGGRAQVNPDSIETSKMTDLCTTNWHFPYIWSFEGDSLKL